MVTPPAVVDDMLPVVAPPWLFVEEDVDLPEGVMILRSCVKTRVLVAGDWVRPRVHYPHTQIEWIRTLCSKAVGILWQPAPYVRSLERGNRAWAWDRWK